MARALLWLIALVIVGAGVGAAVWRLRTPVIPAETRLDITMPPTTDPSFAISPDARHLVFVAASKGQSMLWLRPLDTTAARPEGGTNPGTAWGPDNSILFFRGGARGLLRIAASGGEVAAVTKLPPGALNELQPQILTDGKHFIFFFRSVGENVRGMYLAALGDANATRLTDADAPGRYIHPGWLAYIREGSLVARRFDVEQGVLTGEQVPIAGAVAYDRARPLCPRRPPVCSPIAEIFRFGAS